MQTAPENGDGRLDERVEALATWVDEIADRVRATELATGGEKAAKELRRAIEAVAKHDPKLESRLTERVDVLMDRFGTLASAVSTTSAELARRDGEIAALRRELEQGSARIEALAKDLNSAARVADVAKLREAISARPSERPAKRGEERLDRVEGKLALLAERIDTLAPTVVTAAAGHAARDGELANLRQKLERSAGEVEQIVAELRADPRVAALNRRIDSLASELESTAGKVAGRAEDVAALRVRIDDAYAKASAVISELQLSLATVSSRLGVIEKLPETVEQAFAARTEELDTRLETLSETVTSTGSKLADLERASSEQAQYAAARTHELESLRRETGARLDAFEQDREAVAAEIDHVAKALDTGRTAVQAQLDGLTGDVAAATEAMAHHESGIARIFASQAGELDARLEALSGTVSAAVSKLVRVETTSSEQAASMAAQTDELESLRTEARTRLDAVEHDREALTAEIDRVAMALDMGKATVRAQLDGLVATVERVEQSTASDESQRRLDELDAQLEMLAQTVTSAAGKLAALETASSESIDRVANALDDGRTSLQAQLDGLVAGLARVEQSTAGDGSQRMLGELAERLEVLSGELAATSGALADREIDIGALRARIDEAYAKASAVISELQLSLGAVLSRVGVLEGLPERMEHALHAREGDLGLRLNQLDEASSEQADLLVDLGARIAQGEQGRVAAREEIDRILDTWALDRSSLETRLDEVTTTLTKTGSDIGNAEVSVDEVTRLRALVDGLQLRLTASEQEVAVLRSAPDLGSRLDDVTSRLAAIERDAHGVFVSPRGPVAGDGRFRLELRAFELRIEQAEEDAREGRDAFVDQLERLASRIDWRLQRLESEDMDPSREDPTPTGAQVVPFRGAEV